MTVFLVLAIVVSLIANVVLVLAAKRLYAARCAVELDPIGLATFGPGDAPVSTASVVLFGDSRAAHWTTPETIAGLPVFNRGVSGQTTAQVLARFDAHVLSLQPQVVIIEVGMNDLKSIPLFAAKADWIVDQCFRNIESMVSTVVARGASVVLVTIFPVGEVPLYRRPIYSGQVDAAIRTVNNRIRGLAGERVRVLDADTFFLGGDGRLRAGFGKDMLHLNPAGYRELNLRLVPMVTDMVESQRGGLQALP